MVRVTSDRTNLTALGVTDFVVGDMMDRGSLKAALAQSPRSDALIASAAGYTRHFQGDSEATDTEGYKNLVDACKEAGLPRFVLISILESDKAVNVPHFHHKYLVEEHLKKVKQPFIALRAGAFLDQARDMVLPQVKEGIYPELFHGVSLGMVYTPIWPAMRPWRQPAYRMQHWAVRLISDGKPWPAVLAWPGLSPRFWGNPSKRNRSSLPW